VRSIRLLDLPSGWAGFSRDGAALPSASRKSETRQLECRLNLAAASDAPGRLTQRRTARQLATSPLPRAAPSRGERFFPCGNPGRPGMLGDSGLDGDACRPHPGPARPRADASSTHRARGDKLKAIILERLQGMREHVPDPSRNPGNRRQLPGKDGNGSRTLTPTTTDPQEVALFRRRSTWTKNRPPAHPPRPKSSVSSAAAVRRAAWIS